jgi:hypothetical protein
MGSSSESQVERFVRMLLLTGAWLDEVVSGLSAELPTGSYPGEEPTAVVLEMLCGTIGTALQSVDSRDLQLATQLIDLAGSRVEEHLLADELSQRMHDRADGDARDLWLRATRRAAARSCWSVVRQGSAERRQGS